MRKIYFSISEIVPLIENICLPLWKPQNNNHILKYIKNNLSMKEIQQIKRNIKDCIRNSYKGGI